MLGLLLLLVVVVVGSFLGTVHYLISLKYTCYFIFVGYNLKISH